MNECRKLGGAKSSLNVVLWVFHIELRGSAVWSLVSARSLWRLRMIIAHCALLASSWQHFAEPLPISYRIDVSWLGGSTWTAKRRPTSVDIVRAAGRRRPADLQVPTTCPLRWREPFVSDEVAVGERGQEAEKRGHVSPDWSLRMPLDRFCQTGGGAVVPPWPGQFDVAQRRRPEACLVLRLAGVFRQPVVAARRRCDAVIGHVAEQGAGVAGGAAGLLEHARAPHASGGSSASPDAWRS